MPGQRIKKKSLRASEFLTLLKIEGFGGKFQVTAPVAETQQPETPPSSASKVAKQAVAANPEKIKPSSSFRLKKEFAATATHYEATSGETVSEKQEKVVVRETFNLEQVTQALQEYIQIHNPETAVAMALTTHKPEVKGEKIVVEVDNDLQMTKLNDIKPGLHNLLADKLKNGFIKLSFHIFDNSDGKEEKKLFTSHDKFEHFMQVNPAVAELKAIFGLEIE